MQGRNIIIFSPNLNITDVHEYYPQRTVLAKSWDEVIKELKSHHSGRVEVSVFPCASMQLRNSNVVC